MSRQKRHRRAKKAGISTNDNFKSKTSPSAIKRNTTRWKAYFTLGRVYRRKHCKRTETKARLTAELGLPADAVFIFRWSKNSDHVLFDRPPIMIYFGTVVVINAEDLSLVMVVRCTRFKDMDPSLRGKFDHSVSISFKVARARWKCESNGAVQKIKEEGKFWGWMGCAGWRGGTDPGISLGPYCLSDFTCRYLDRILADEIRMATFHWIRDFLAERFSSLALSVFKSNLEIGLITKVPGFDDVEWQDTPNGKVFASNMVVSCDGFYNEPHTDHDHTRYAFGINCLIDRETGKPYQLEGSENKGSIVGSLFVLKDFDIAVDYDRCDGIYETVWDSQAEHYTAESVTYDKHGDEISPKKKIYHGTHSMGGIS